jgi:hypothetical protein
MIPVLLLPDSALVYYVHYLLVPVELIACDLNINRLKPAYFSTTTNSWTRPDSYVVDEEWQTITMQIDHCALFSLVGEEAGYQVL